MKKKKKKKEKVLAKEMEGSEIINGFIIFVLKVLLRSLIVPSDQYRPTFIIIWKIFAPKGRVWPKKKS